MPPESCGILVLRSERDMQLRNASDSECLRLRGHDGEHVFQNSLGQYFAWEDDYDCDCCSPDEPDRCFQYGKISDQQANQLLLKERE